MLTKSQVLTQLRRLRTTGFDQRLKSQAEATNLPVAFFYAIASRETNCRNILGDKQGGEFHGVGIVQIDIQHEIARTARDTGSWKTNPDPLIKFGAKILKSNIQKAKSAFPDISTRHRLKIAASGYNCGIGRAVQGEREGDSDNHTTGHDYGRDVMARMKNFEELIDEDN